MKQRQLGPNGPLVGTIGVGGMPMSVKSDAERVSREDGIAVLARAAELGLTLWDTADAYCQNDGETGHNERLFAAALKSLPTDLRDTIVVATKGGHIRPNGEWVTDGRPEHLRAALDASLVALELDAIPLYQFHRPDPKVNFADSVGVLREALDAGKIQFAGLSNVSVEQIRSPEGDRGDKEEQHAEKDDAQRNRDDQPCGGESKRLQRSGTVDTHRDHRYLQAQGKAQQLGNARIDAVDKHADLPGADDPPGLRCNDQQHEVEQRQQQHGVRYIMLEQPDHGSVSRPTPL